MRTLVLLAMVAATGAAASAKEIEVADGLEIPAVRPCIDIVARGDLRSVGEPEPFYFEDDLIGHEIYTWRFTTREVLFGDMPKGTRDLSRSDHALVWPQPPSKDVLVLLTRRGNGLRFLESLSVRQDREGRRYVPILRADDVNYGGRSRDWRPDALSSFARPVPRATDSAAHGGNTDAERVVARLYLEDFPALMEAARTEDCWR